MCFKLSDDAITKGIIAKDDKTIQYLYVKIYPVVKKFILANNGTESVSEDVFQEALLRLYLKLRSEQLELTCSFSTYIIAICKNIWLDQLRKSRNANTYKNDIIDVYYPKTVSPNYFPEVDFNEIFFKHYKKLNESSQKIIALHFYNVPVKEIALIMGLKDKDQAISRKYKSLKKLINGIKNDPEMKDVYIEHSCVDLLI